MKKLIFIFAFASLFVSSCYYDSEEAMFPQLQACDSTLATFSGQVKPMIEGNCLGCHGSGGTSPTLTGYNEIKNNATAISGSINHTSGQQMPLGAAKLDDCYLKQYKKWMDAGMPNN